MINDIDNNTNHNHNNKTDNKDNINNDNITIMIPNSWQISARSTADMMNMELKMVLESFRRQRPHLDIVKTPDAYINQKSTPKEVQDWLQIKGFSKR